jgi:23S rRNA pseudoU1915 N3-methylase RlmH
MKPQKPSAEPRSTLIGSRRAKTIVSSKEQKETKDKPPTVLAVNTSQLEAGTHHPSPSSPTLYTSQTLGKGRSRVLLCVDNDDDIFSGDPFPAIDTLDFFSNLDDDGSPENPALQPEVELSPTAAQVSVEEVKPPSSSVPATSKLKRKVSQVVRKFTYLQKMMPQYKLDKELKTEITTTMVDLNYWSDNDLEEIQKEKDISPSPKRTSSLERKDTRIISPSGSITLDGGRSRSTVISTQSSKSQLSPPSQKQLHPQPPQQHLQQLSQPSQQSPRHQTSPQPRQPIRIYQSPPIPKPEVQKSQDQQKTPRKVIIITKPIESPLKKTQPTGIQSLSTSIPAHTVNELSQPVTVKKKVELVKPKQIQISQQLQTKVAKMEKTKEDERKNIREQIVSKAVQTLIKLENDQVTSSQKKHQSNAKDKNDKKVKLLRRFAHGIVDKAIKKMKREAYIKYVQFLCYCFFLIPFFLCFL